MLTETNLDALETERAAMWELFALIMELHEPFTAKQLAKEIEYTKSELNKLFFRLYLQKALLIEGKTPTGASIYRINPEFLESN
jgi:hypothetical protein